MNFKKVLLILCAVFVILLIALSLLLGSKPDSTPLENEMISPVSSVAQYAITYSNNGNVFLYNIDQNVLLDQFDLKAFNQKEATVDSAISDNISENILLDAENHNSDFCSCLEDSNKEHTYKGFAKTEVVVERGDSAWKIQQSLTPNRNTALMLKYVAEINGRINLHPIYPGENIIFLKEVGNSMEELEHDEEISESSFASTTPYLFYNDLDQKALFVFGNDDKAIYKIIISGDKLNLEKLSKNEEFVIAKGIYVHQEKILLAENGTKKLQIYDIGDQSIKSIELDGILTNWVVKDNELYYTYENRLGKINLETMEKKDVLLGDESIDMVMFQDKLYVLSAFGNQVDNSLFMMIHPSDLKVHDFIEMNSNMINILSKGDEEKLYLGRIEKVDGRTKETPKIVFIDTKHFSIESSGWKMAFHDESVGYNSHLYMLGNGVLSIYTLNNSDPIHTIEVSGEAFMIVP